MKTARHIFLMIVAAALAVAILPIRAQALTPEEAEAIAMDAYIYGYSLITTEVTRVQMTNVDKGRSSARHATC